MNSEKKKKVLVVPAWYPALFFTEQMELMTSQFDFRVIHGNRIKIGKKKAMWLFIKGNLVIYNCDEKEGQFHETTISFSWINHLPGFIEKKQYKYLNRLFQSKLDNYGRAGWTPDLIHIQSISDTAVFISNWAKQNGIPVILTEHLIYIRRKHDLFQKEVENLYSVADKTLCVSNYVYRNLITTGFILKKAEIIGNMVDDRFVAESLGKKDLPRKILFVASHLADKDIDILFKSLSILVKTGYKDFELHIIGLDPLKMYHTDYDDTVLITNEIEKHKLTDYITIIGPLSRKEILESYKNYSFLVSTSLSETFGLVVAEAIANGLPVVCTDSGGIRDFVNETNGIIVPIRNPLLVSNAIMEMMANLDKFDSMAISEAIRNKYGREAFTRKLLDEYHLALQNKRLPQCLT